MNNRRAYALRPFVFISRTRITKSVPDKEK